MKLCKRYGPLPNLSADVIPSGTLRKSTKDKASAIEYNGKEKVRRYSPEYQDFVQQQKRQWYSYEE